MKYWAIYYVATDGGWRLNHFDASDINTAHIRTIRAQAEYPKWTFMCVEEGTDLKSLPPPKEKEDD